MTKHFKQKPKAVLRKEKARGLRLRNSMRLEKLTKWFKGCKSLSLKGFFSVKTRKEGKPFRANVTWVIGP